MQVAGVTATENMKGVKITEENLDETLILLVIFQGDHCPNQDMPR